MQIKKPLEFDTWFGSGLLFFAVQKEIVSEINKKSEPISNLENLVRIICVWCAAEHPNTATIKMTGQSGKQMTMTACSLGGGRIMVTEFNGLQAKFSCDLPTLIVQNTDQPGRVGIVTSLLAKGKINIATLHVYRDHPGGNAVMIIEMDKPASKAIVESLSKAEGIKRVITVGGER